MLHQPLPWAVCSWPVGGSLRARSQSAAAPWGIARVHHFFGVQRRGHADLQRERAGHAGPGLRAAAQRHRPGTHLVRAARTSGRAKLCRWWPSPEPCCGICSLFRPWLRSLRSGPRLPLCRRRLPGGLPAVSVSALQWASLGVGPCLLLSAAASDAGPAKAPGELSSLSALALWRQALSNAVGVAALTARPAHPAARLPLLGLMLALSLLMQFSEDACSSCAWAQRSSLQGAAWAVRPADASTSPRRRHAWPGFALRGHTGRRWARLGIAAPQRQPVLLQVAGHVLARQALHAHVLRVQHAPQACRSADCSTRSDGLWSGVEQTCSPSPGSAAAAPACLHDGLGHGMLHVQLAHGVHEARMQLGRPHQPGPLHSPRDGLLRTCARRACCSLAGEPVVPAEHASAAASAPMGAGTGAGKVASAAPCCHATLKWTCAAACRRNAPAAGLAAASAAARRLALLSWLSRLASEAFDCASAPACQPA